MNKITANSTVDYDNRSFIPGMEPGGADVCSSYQYVAYPLKNGTIIEYKSYRNAFSITINSVEAITPSYILYSGQKKCQNEIIEPVEIVELFVTPNDKRDVDGKTRLKTCNSFENGFYKLIERDSLLDIRQIVEFFCDEYGLNENFIVANNTRYYVKMKKRECPKCRQLYPSKYPCCPYCRHKASGKKHWFKRMCLFFRI